MNWRPADFSNVCQKADRCSIWIGEKQCWVVFSSSMEISVTLQSGKSLCNIGYFSTITWKKCSFRSVWGLVGTDVEPMEIYICSNTVIVNILNEIVWGQTRCSCYRQLNWFYFDEPHNFCWLLYIVTGESLMLHFVYCNWVPYKRKL